MSGELQRAANPYDAKPRSAQVTVSQGGLVPNDNPMAVAAASGEIARIQAQFIAAKQFPRDQKVAADRIATAFERPSLAATGTYQYARGGTAITGLSIRAAEAIAQCWGNLDFGFRELEQTRTESVCEAFCLDLETNIRKVMVFRVPMVRETKRGNVNLENPRDRYELVANQASRRVRACILATIPGDVLDMAQRQIEITLQTNFAITPEYIRDMLASFEQFGVTKEQIEAMLQRRIDTMQPAQAVKLGNIYNSLCDGMSSPSDWFDMPEQTPAARDAAKGGKPTLESMAAARAEERKAAQPKQENAGRQAAKPQSQAKKNQGQGQGQEPAPVADGGEAALAKALADAKAPVDAEGVKEWCNATGQLFAPDLFIQDLSGVVNAVLDWQDSLTGSAGQSAK